MVNAVLEVPNKLFDKLLVQGPPPDYLSVSNYFHLNCGEDLSLEEGLALEGLLVLLYKSKNSITYYDENERALFPRHFIKDFFEEFSQEMKDVVNFTSFCWNSDDFTDQERTPRMNWEEYCHYSYRSIGRMSGKSRRPSDGIAKPELLELADRVSEKFGLPLCLRVIRVSENGGWHSQREYPRWLLDGLDCFGLE